MSGQPTNDSTNESIRMKIESRMHDLGGGFKVRRILPVARRRMIGPFTFLDHMGPVEFGPGQGIDVLPHPHIGLSTVTYHFEGVITHRDSLGVEQDVRPGEVNWMTAGRGITHSERTPPEPRAKGQRLHGLQIWVALPREAEEIEPEFDHYPAEVLPGFELGNARITLVAGEAYGRVSPVKTYSKLFYLDAILPPGAEFEFDASASGSALECACYAAIGSVRVAGEQFDQYNLAVMEDGARFMIKNDSDRESRAVILGGENIGSRKMYWNFVATNDELLERAKQNWRDRKFPPIPGDDEEFVPLP